MTYLLKNKIKFHKLQKIYFKLNILSRILNFNLYTPFYFLHEYYSNKEEEEEEDYLALTDRLLLLPSVLCS